MKFFILSIITLFLAVSCDKKDAAKNEDKAVVENDHSDHDHDDHGHHHEAPHGGILEGLDGHKASLEWLVEKDNLILHIHDGCAEKSIKIAQESVEIAVLTDAGEKTLVMNPLVSELSGNKVGSSSTFQNKEDGVNFESVKEIKVKSIEIQGITYKDIKTKVE